MFGLFLIEDWNGNIRLMRASNIHKKVMDKSKKSNYNWIASATDLISVCEKKKFPEKYATDIKIAVLNCFSQVMLTDRESNEKETDLEAVYYAYNSLYETKSEKAIKARSNFLNSFLLYITSCNYKFLFRGELYHKYCNEWRNAKFQKLINEQNINFEQLKIVLEKEFDDAIQKADEDKIFVSDDEIVTERILKYIKESVDHSCLMFDEAEEKPKVKNLTKN